ncbi:hypothetical protein LRP52_23910 [Photobacterium sp. ZSDE20]|uniref:Uncharacterized protein n=1 Tax=Photobacterium pectinilyticum TaxID=2906793 RepID=A0ABT1N1I3_9GAMM|nr:hypothetical protein [Photobacterium sp. ZSDE20]MCQ1058397.1 hypothetical protein [Photobacterium sp. ZSDE20]MDD1825240.1 hypothetical protein [Photobacterium sp. ZSDE20]
MNTVKSAKMKSLPKFSLTSVFILGLVVVNVYQSMTINQLTNEVQQNINLIENMSVQSQPKIAILPFDTTLKRWNEVDPSGLTGINVVERAVDLYSNNGYLILDSKVVLGGRAWAEVINVLPEEATNAN